MSRGGFRGRGRGGYRGSGGGSSGSWPRGGIRRGRGGENGFSSRGDRFNDWSDNSYGGGGDRFSSRSGSRMEDSGYRRFGGQASSMRRSQDESFGRRSEFRGYRGADKESSTGYGSRPRTSSYPLRKSAGSTFRGRFSSSRSIGRSRGGRISRSYRPDFTLSRIERNLAALEVRTAREDLRRLRMSSALKSIKDLETKMKSEEDIDWDKDDIGDDEEVEEEVETEVEVEEEEGEQEDDNDDNVEKEDKGDADDEAAKDEEGESKEETTPKKKLVKKTVKKIVKKVVKKKTPTKKKESKEEGEKVEGEDEEAAGEEAEEKTDKDTPKKEEDEENAAEKTVEKLECPQCKTTCVTEKGYNRHLKGAKHLSTMQKLSLTLSSKLNQMRIEQRREQRLIDEKRGSRNLKTVFCSICKLNYRCLTAAHIRSFRHKRMKKFLLPWCRACDIIAKSPMQYEHHACEISHMKKAAERAARKAAFKKDLDKENFMVVDAVGSQDDDSGDDKEGKEKSNENGEKESKTPKEGEEPPEKKKKSEIELGYEFCKQISVLFCDLCESYLPQACSAMEDTALAAHCRSRKHMDRFIQLKKYQRRTILEKSEKMEEKELEAKKKKAAGKEAKAVNGVTEKSPKKKEKSSEAEAADDEKIWSALGDFLDQVETTGKSSDDEEAGERYDRFKDSETKEGKAMAGDEEEEEEDDDMNG